MPSHAVNDLTDRLPDVLRDPRSELDLDALGDEARVRATKALAQAAELRSELGERAGEFAGELGERAEVLGARARDRVHEFEDELGYDRHDAWQAARFGGWHVVRAVLAVATAVPRLIVAVLGWLADAVDDLADRGADVSERTRELADAVPAASATRRRDRRRTVLLLGGGVVAGLLGGLALGRRRAPIVTYEPIPAAATPPPVPGEVTGADTDELDATPADEAGERAGDA